MKTAPGLLAQIRSGALDSGVSLADLLRKCVALGGEAGSAQLRDWARQELEGYTNGEDLPSYRRLTAPLYLHGSNLAYLNVTQQISPMMLPDGVRDLYGSTVDVPFGVAELQAQADKAAKKGPVQLQPPGLPEVAAYMQQDADYGTSIHSIYYRVDSSQLFGVLDTIRTNLVALVAEITAAGVADDQVPPSDVAERAVQVVIKGVKRGNVYVNNAVAVGGGDAAATQSKSATAAKKSRVPGFIRGPWGVMVGLAALVAAYAAFAVPLKWPPF